MAKPRVTYESSGDYLRPPQNIDFAGQRENIAGYTQMTQKLDQMSNYFMQQAEGMAKLEGAEYGALNAPTEQQLEDAFVQDKEVELPGDTFSVFGRQARAAALETVYNDLEVMAKKKILFDITDYEKQELDPSMLGEKFDTIINGYAATFDETSPTLAKKFRADVGLFAYSKLQGEMSDYLKVEKKKARAALVTSFNFATMDGGFIHTELKNMTPVIPKGGIQEGVELLPPAEELKTKIASHKYKFAKDALALGFTQTEVNTLLDDFDKRVTLIRKNIVTQEILQTEPGGKAVLFKRMETALRQGPKSKTAKELPTEIYNAIFSASSTEALEIINLARTGYNTHLEDIEKVINHKKKIRDDNKETYEQSFKRGMFMFTNPTGANAEEIEQVRDRGLEMMTTALSTFEQQGFDDLYKINKVTFDKITRVTADGSGFNSMAIIDNTDVVIRFKTDLANINPAMSVADVQIAFNKNQITFETFLDLSDKYKTNLSEEDKAAIKLMKNKLDMSDNFYVDKEFLSTQKNKIYTATLSRYITDKAAAGNDFRPLKWVDEVMPSIVRDTANANPIPDQVLHKAFEGKLNNQGKAYTLGGQTAFITHYKSYTRSGLNRLIRKAIADGHSEMAEMLQRDKEILDELVTDPNFDRQQINNYNIRDN